MAKTYHESAPAKINLSLAVTGRDNQSGYHFLDMVNARISLIDKLTVDIADSNDSHSVDSFALTGAYQTAVDGSTLSDSNNNLVCRTLKAFRETFDVGDSVQVTLDKQIPVGAGLGGGSSDAAAMLRVLCKHYFNNEYPKEVFDIALKLGADVPYFLPHDPWQRVTGKGEELSELSDTHPALQLRNQLITLFVPNFPVNTKESFAKFKELGLSFSSKILDEKDWCLGKNDLLQASFAAQPLLGKFYEDLKKMLPAVDIFMSGSGSSLYTVSSFPVVLPDGVEQIKAKGGRVLMLTFL